VTTPRIAITGTTGRAGAALAARLANLCPVIPLPRSALDLAHPRAMAETLAELECDVMVNPAAVTSLEECLDHPQQAWRINAEAPGELAAWSARNGVRLIHFSTDYVLDGARPGLKAEDDPVAPLSDYARSKLAGEQAVLSHPGTCVLRVSWLFGPEKPSFIDQVRHQALRGEAIAAVADKFSLPTYTADLADWVWALARSNATGVVHACNSGQPVSWHGIARETLDLLHRAGALAQPPPLTAQALDAMPFRAPRPRHTAMATHRLAAEFGIHTRPWQEALASYLASL
jgi:dTDP-4-dehydrorhamnose reductase